MEREIVELALLELQGGGQRLDGDPRRLALREQTEEISQGKGRGVVEHLGLGHQVVTGTAAKDEDGAIAPQGRRVSGARRGCRVGAFRRRWPVR